QREFTHAARLRVEGVAVALDIDAPARHLTTPREDLPLRPVETRAVDVLERRVRCLARRSLWRRRLSPELVDHQPSHAIESIRAIGLPRQALGMRHAR